MKNFFERYTNLVLTLSLAVIAFTVVFAVLFYIILPNYRPIISLDSITMPPLASGKTVSNGGLLEAGSDLSSLIGISLLVVLVLFGLSGFSLYGHMRHQKLERDQRRKDDLAIIVQGFETYRSIHGHYPMSSTYQPEYYTGINLSKDWNYYGLPNADQMRMVIKNWPLSDPSIDYNASNQANQYLYYPRNEGRSFDLYAHLELPKPQETADYNAIDNLLRTWGSYNYKVSSPNQTAPTATIEEGRPMSPEEIIRQQSTMTPAMASTSNSGQVNEELRFLADEVVADARPPLPDPVVMPSVSMPATSQDQVGSLGQAVMAKQTIAQSGESFSPELNPLKDAQQ